VLVLLLSRLKNVTDELDSTRTQAWDLHLQYDKLSSPLPDALRIQPQDRVYGISIAEQPDQPGYYWRILADKLAAFSATRSQEVLMSEYFRDLEPETARRFEGKPDVYSRRVDWPESRMRRDEIVAAMRSYTEDEDRRYETMGLKSLANKIDALTTQQDELIETIAETAAKSLVGLMAKASMIDCLMMSAETDIIEDDSVQTLALSLINDLLALRSTA
jgi:hypothetical protein